MENAADAFKMAAAFLVFVLALSISINAFGEARQTSQVILNNRDREYDYSYVIQNGETERIVGMETIIPTIYKAYKENYKIIFDFKNDNNYLYEKAGTKIYYIDLEKEVLGNDSEKETFIKTLIGPTRDSEEVEKFKRLGITFNSQNLYSMLQKKRFKESLGIYYQEELQEQLQGGDASNVPDANRTEKRVITYTII